MAARNRKSGDGWDCYTNPPNSVLDSVIHDIINGTIQGYYKNTGRTFDIERDMYWVFWPRYRDSRLGYSFGGDGKFGYVPDSLSREGSNIWRYTQIDPFPAGRSVDDWKEYCEKPIEHNLGFFWMRSDDLRLGYRPAGDYYRQGAIPMRVFLRDYGDCTPNEASPLPIRYYLKDRVGSRVPALGYSAEDVDREMSKRERLPSHYRIMQDDLELALITHLDGVSVERLDSEKDFKMMLKYVDKRWPSRKSRLEQVTTKKK